MRYALLAALLAIGLSGSAIAQTSTPNAQTHEKVSKSPHHAHGAATTMPGSADSMHMKSHRQKSHMQQ